MITLYTQEGFGNQIWQYAITRYFAYKHNLTMRLGGHIVGNQSHEKRCTLYDVFRYIDIPNGITLEGDKIVIYNRCDTTPFCNKPTQPIEFRTCYFETKFLPPIQLLKKWLIPNRKTSKKETNIIHIRTGDFLTNPGNSYTTDIGIVNSLSIAYFYINSFKLLCSKFPTQIVTDNKNDFIPQKVSKVLRIDISDGTWIDDWYKLYEASNIITHYRSTFSWWAIKLGYCDNFITCDKKSLTPYKIPTTEQKWYLD